VLVAALHHCLYRPCHAQKHWFSHNYQLTAVEAYLDMYVLTANTTYLNVSAAAAAGHYSMPPPPCHASP